MNHTWMDDSACRDGSIEMVDPNGPSAKAEALALCQRCPVIADCASWAHELPSHEVTGTWAGQWIPPTSAPGSAAPRRQAFAVIAALAD